MGESEITEIKQQINRTEKLKSVKEGHIGITVSSLLGLIPIIGDFVDSEVDKKFTEFQNEKREKLIEVILSDSERITKEMVQDVEFIINFSKALEAVNKLATNDKVKYFANLIRNSYLCDEQIENDVFEEYLNILNELSFREINYLLFLRDNQIGNGKKGVKWIDFIKRFEEKFNISKKNVYNIYYRLKRTGFVDEELSLSSGNISGDVDTGFELDSSDIDSNRFFLTSLFDDFYNRITNE
ncbi:hypothetical protein GND98_017360 [Clostridium butyricum]|uniref:Uncharacterized protein n=1 Tax=Clostridium butyricum TaxID=1492 RepID=A0A6L9ESK0_CLOBU|nr:hypothetical protein [Clostridium butyricum]